MFKDTPTRIRTSKKNPGFKEVPWQNQLQRVDFSYTTTMSTTVHQGTQQLRERQWHHRKSSDPGAFFSVSSGKNIGNLFKFDETCLPKLLRFSFGIFVLSKCERIEARISDDSNWYSDSATASWRGSGSQKHKMLQVFLVNNQLFVLELVRSKLKVCQNDCQKTAN